MIIDDHNLWREGMRERKWLCESKLGSIMQKSQIFIQSNNPLSQKAEDDSYV